MQEDTSEMYEFINPFYASYGLWINGDEKMLDMFMQKSSFYIRLLPRRIRHRMMTHWVQEEVDRLIDTTIMHIPEGCVKFGPFIVPARREVIEDFPPVYLIFDGPAGVNYGLVDANNDVEYIRMDADNFDEEEFDAGRDRLVQHRLISAALRGAWFRLSQGTDAREVFDLMLEFFRKLDEEINKARLLELINDGKSMSVHEFLLLGLEAIVAAPGDDDEKPINPDDIVDQAKRISRGEDPDDNDVKTPE